MPGSGQRHVVVAALLRQHGRVLLCHRRPGRAWYPDTWDLPGGHVEEGEAPRQALGRELGEELGIQVTSPATPFAHVQGADHRMDIWLMTSGPVSSPTGRRLSMTRWPGSTSLRRPSCRWPIRDSWP